MTNGGVLRRVLCASDELMDGVAESLRLLETGDKEQILQSLDHAVICYEQLEGIGLAVGSYRDQGNIKARFTRVKRGLEEATVAVKLEQYRRAREMMELILLPSLRRLRERLDAVIALESNG
ncbi:hypothetical protein [Natribacillus halophilus]|uniref:Uncharacterized protein n=1 Tax=Natribacillus halophilus TaxID=549003 RepID=A0A1G8KNK0_9BACI|nr:hypothetical protein [Natribacillus halophilus]SDI44988.1 hypothetical protein SAMN04488123_102213 [Natribacillus halophilus]